MRKLLLIIMLVFTSLIYFSCDTAENPEDKNKDIPSDPTGVTVPTPTKTMCFLQHRLPRRVVG